MSKLRGKGILAVLIIVVIIFFSGVLGWKALQTQGRKNGLQSAARWTEDFHQHQQVYEALVGQWEQIYPGASECEAGTDASKGLVEYRLFQVNGASIRLAGQGSDKEVSGVGDAAKLLNVPVVNVQHVIDLLSSVQKQGMSQSGAQRRIWAKVGDTDGLLHVSITCPQYSNYHLWANTTGRTPFARLQDLGAGWFYYDERR